MTNEGIKTTPDSPIFIRASQITLKEVLRRGDPVLKEQQRQLFIGIAVLMMIIVLLYPTGHKDSESLSPSLLLIFGLTLPIINNLLGYRFIGRPFMRRTVLENYQQERENIKRFTILTAFLRGLAGGILIGCMFFNYKLDEARLWIIRGILLLYVVDLGYIIRLWIKRFGRLLSNLDYFHSLIYPEDPS